MFLQSPKLPGYIEAAPLFEPTDPLPEHLSGLNGRTLADLHDLALKFGFAYEGLNQRYLQIRKPFAFRVSATVPDYTFGQTCLMVGSPSGAITILVPTGFVLWNRSIAVKDVRRAIREEDCRMMRCGFIDPGTGIRTGIYDPAATGRLAVDDVFADPDTILSPPPSGLAINTFVERFDRPRDLAFVHMACGIRICLKSEAARIHALDKIRTRVRDMIFGRFHIDDLLAFSRMSARRQRKIHRRMDIEIELATRKLFGK